MKTDQKLNKLLQDFLSSSFINDLQAFPAMYRFSQNLHNLIYNLQTLNLEKHLDHLHDIVKGEDQPSKTINLIRACNGQEQIDFSCEDLINLKDPTDNQNLILQSNIREVLKVGESELYTNEISINYNQNINIKIIFGSKDIEIKITKLFTEDGLFKITLLHQTTINNFLYNVERDVTLSKTPCKTHEELTLKFSNKIQYIILSNFDVVYGLRLEDLLKDKKEVFKNIKEMSNKIINRFDSMDNQILGYQDINWFPAPGHFRSTYSLYQLCNFAVGSHLNILNILEIEKKLLKLVGMDWEDLKELLDIENDPVALSKGVVDLREF